MARSDALSDARILQFTAELGLECRRDEFSLQLTSARDKFVFVRIEPRSDTQSTFAITDLNHSSWDTTQEAQAIELALRLLGAQNIVSIWFEKPYNVRRTSAPTQDLEEEYLSNLLKLVAQRWPAFIDGQPWSSERKLGVNFLP
ncbi:MAG: hypothetical protein ABJX35_01665 [Hyphomicrobiales bacterium]